MRKIVYKETKNYNWFLQNIPTIFKLLIDIGCDLRPDAQFQKSYINSDGKIQWKTISNWWETKIKFGFIIGHFLRRYMKVFYDKQRSFEQNSWEDILKRRNKNIALQQHPYSKTIVIDVDYHNLAYNRKVATTETISIIKYIQSFLNVTPIYSEISRHGTGAHLLYQLDLSYNRDILLKTLINILKKSYENDEVTFECRSETHGIRLFSADYFSYDYNRNCKVVSLDKVIKSIYTKMDTEIVNTLLFLTNNLPEKGIYQRYKQDNTINIHGNDYSMTKGDRVSNHIRLGFACISNGKDLNEFKQLCRHWNRGSKDLSSRNSFDKVCDHIYKWCNDHYKSNSSSSDSISPNQFISNMDKLSSKDIILSNKYKYAIPRQYRSDMYIVIKECIGKVRYDGINPRTSQVVSKRFLSGSQFSREYLIRLKKHYNLKIGIRRMINLLRSHICIKINNGDYIPKISCIQYVLKSSTEEGNKNIEYAVTKVEYSSIIRRDVIYYHPKSREKDIDKEET